VVAPSESPPYQSSALYVSHSVLMHEMVKDRPRREDHAIDRVDLLAGATSSRKTTLLFVSLSCIFVYLQVFVLPGTPRLASGDQAIYLHHATRMLDGEMIYRDYDHFTLPGADVLYAALFKCFGVRAWIPQAMLVVLGASMVWLIIFISRKLMSGTAVYLPALLFITLPFSSYLDATHHWYSLVATTAALAILLKERSTARLVSAGALLGIAAFFTQSMMLLVVGFALYLLWERGQENQTWGVLVKKELCFVAGFLVTISACLVYFVWMVGAKKIFYYTVTFVAKYYPADWFNNWRVYLTGRPQLHAWTTWFDLPAFALIHLIIPFVYIFFFVYAIGKRMQYSEELWRRLMLVNITGVFLFLTVASAPESSRLYVVSPPALVILVWLFDSLPRVPRSFLPFAWATVLIMLMARPLVAQMRWKAYLDLPTGRTAFFDPLLYEKCKWMSQRTQPSDYFFGDHLISFALRLRNVGRAPFLRPTDYTRPEEVADAIQGIDKFHVRFVSWYVGLDRERDAARHPEGNHLAPIRQYLQEHFHVAQTFANGDQTWERNR
jgi:hypothetical protein